MITYPCIINVGVKFSLGNKEFVAIVECNNCDDETIYFGIGRHFVSNEKTTTPQTLQTILDNNKLEEPEDFWYGWKYTSLDDAYFELKALIKQILSFN